MAYAYAHSGRPPYEPIVTSDGKIWFDGYDGEDVVFFDEFDGSARYSYIKTITDRYDNIRVENKGGTSLLQRIKAVIINTNNPPGTWWPATPRRAAEPLDPLYRRIRLSGGCYAEWEGTAENYVQDGRVYAPTKIHVPDNYVWRAYPDPPGSNEAAPISMFPPFFNFSKYGAGAEVGGNSKPRYSPKKVRRSFTPHFLLSMSDLQQPPQPQQRIIPSGLPHRVRKACLLLMKHYGWTSFKISVIPGMDGKTDLLLISPAEVCVSSRAVPTTTPPTSSSSTMT